MADSIIASNFRKLGKSNLIGTVDIEITGWRLCIKECLWFRKEGGDESIEFPRREYKDREGNRKFAEIIAWTDQSVRKRFQNAALKAVHGLVNDP